MTAKIELTRERDFSQTRGGDRSNRSNEKRGRGLSWFGGGEWEGKEAPRSSPMSGSIEKRPSSSKEEMESCSHPRAGGVKEKRGGGGTRTVSAIMASRKRKRRRKRGEEVLTRINLHISEK